LLVLKIEKKNNIEKHLKFKNIIIKESLCMIIYVCTLKITRGDAIIIYTTRAVRVFHSGIVRINAKHSNTEILPNTISDALVNIM